MGFTRLKIQLKITISLISEEVVFWRGKHRGANAPQIFGGPILITSTLNHKKHFVSEKNNASTMDPLKEANTAKKGTQVFSPDGITKEWTYGEIVLDIIRKNDSRKLCEECEREETEETTDVEGSKDCLFFTHQHLLMKEMDEELACPDQKYKNNSKQGARLACYKLYTLLEHGRLGRSRRKPLPVCVEARIKLMLPSKTFTGYKRATQEKQEGKQKHDESSSDDDTWEGTTSSPLRTYKKPKIE